MQHRYSTGFTLVELSIVLVILGLLTGGILAGQSLIRAAGLRSISNDYQRYTAATMAFRDKYFSLPGDMPNATSFWGSLGGTGSDATCQALAASGTTATCNGDGSGSLLWSNALATGYEFGRFWQHLANAGLIEGSYSGVGLTITVSTGVPGTNVPISKWGPQSYFNARPGLNYTAEGNPTYFSGTTNQFPGDYGKTMLFFNTVNASVTVAGSRPLSPEQAWNLDTKMDDGTPGKGKIISLKGNGTVDCTNVGGMAAGSEGNATYKLDNPNADCALFFVTGW